MDPVGSALRLPDSVSPLSAVGVDIYRSHTYSRTDGNKWRAGGLGRSRVMVGSGEQCLHNTEKMGKTFPSPLSQADGLEGLLPNLMTGLMVADSQSLSAAGGF